MEVPCCCRVPVPHPLGVFVGFADPPSFIIPFGCFGVELVVHSGPGKLDGLTADPDTSPVENGVKITFSKVVVTDIGDYVLRVQYSNGNERYNILTPSFYVGSIVVDSNCIAFASALTAATSAAAVIINNKNKATILSNVDKYASAWLIPSNILLPVQNSVFSSLHQTATKLITSLFDCTSYKDEVHELLSRHILKLQSANGTAAAKIPLLAPGIKLGPVPDLNPKIFEKIKESESNLWSSHEEVSGGIRSLGVNVRVSESAATKGNIEVSGMVVTIPPSIKIPGGTVRITAHTLILSSNDVLIDVSGNHGLGALHGCKSAPPGKDGEQGDNGENGGQIIINCSRIVYKSETKSSNVKARIKLKANGGNAGRGQDGGNGLKGSPGTIGRDGCRGGKGGNGGASGVAGAGGKILFSTVSNHPSITLTTDSTSGKAAEPSLGGVGGPGGDAGPRTITPKHSTSGYFFVSHKITEQFGEQRSRGEVGPPGSRGEVHPSPPHKISISQQCSSIFFWGQLVPLPLVGRFTQWVESCYQINDQITLQSLLLTSSILTAQLKNGRPAMKLSQRISLLIKQLTAGYSYWGFRPNYHPLQSYQELRSQIDDLLWSYEKVWEANKKNELAKGKRIVEVNRLEAVRETTRMIQSSRSVVRQQLVGRYDEAVMGLEQATSSLQSSLTSMSVLNEKLTSAIYYEAVKQTEAQLSHSAYQESVSRSLTLLATSLAVYPSLPPSPAVIGHLVAQGRQLQEATSAYYSVLQESFFGLAGQGINFARDYLLTDNKMLQTKTEEALNQIISESQADKTSLGINEIDRWVGGIGLKGENAKIRDAYLSEARNYKRLVNSIQECVTLMEELEKELSTSLAEKERLESEDRALAQTLLRIEWESCDTSKSDSKSIADQCIELQKQLSSSLHVLSLSLQRELIRIGIKVECRITSPMSALCCLTKMDSIISRESGRIHQQSSVVLEEHEPIVFSAEKLIEDLAKNGSCIFGIGPNDHASLSDKPAMTIEKASVEFNSETTISSSITHLGRGGTIFDFDMQPVKFTHPPVVIALDSDLDVKVSPFSLFKLSINPLPDDGDISITQFSVTFTTRRVVYT